MEVVAIHTAVPARQLLSIGQRFAKPDSECTFPVHPGVTGKRPDERVKTRRIAVAGSKIKTHERKNV